MLDSPAPTNSPSDVTGWAGEKFCLYIYTPLPELITASFQWKNNRQVNGAEYSFHLLRASATPFSETGVYSCVRSWVSRGEQADWKLVGNLRVRLDVSFFTNHSFSVWLTDDGTKLLLLLLVQCSLWRKPSEAAAVSFAWMTFKYTTCVAYMWTFRWKPWIWIE